MDKKELSLEKEVLGVVKHVNGISSLVLSNKDNINIKYLESLANTFTEYSNLFNTVYLEEKQKRDKESLMTLGKEINIGISNISCKVMANTKLLTEKDLVGLMKDCDSTIEKIDEYEKLCSERGIMNKYMGVRQFFISYKKSLDTLIGLKTGKDTKESDLVDMVSFIFNSF